MTRTKANSAGWILSIVAAVILVGLLARYERLAAWASVSANVAIVVAISLVIGYLIVRQSGWRALAGKYPAKASSLAAWRTCQTAIVATEAMDHPGCQRHKVRLNFIVRVGIDDQALHVSAVRLLALLLPPMRIPWSAIVRVRYFDPFAWFKYPRSAGLVVWFNYDPGYKEQFVEIQIGEPRTFLQLPAALLREAIPHFPN